MLFRGRKRIRTAVAAFAELSLATRPSDLRSANVVKKSFSPNSFLLHLRIYFAAMLLAIVGPAYVGRAPCESAAKCRQYYVVALA